MLRLRRRKFKMNYDLKGHKRSQKVILKFLKKILRYIICLPPNVLKTFQECQHYEDTNVS